MRCRRWPRARTPTIRSCSCSGKRCGTLRRVALVAHQGTPDEHRPFGDRQRLRRDVALDASAGAEYRPTVHDDVSPDGTAYVRVPRSDVPFQTALRRQRDVAAGVKVALHDARQRDARGLDVRADAALRGQRDLALRADLPCDLALDPERA